MDNAIGGASRGATAALAALAAAFASDDALAPARPAPGARSSLGCTEYSSSLLMGALALGRRYRLSRRTWTHERANAHFLIRILSRSFT